jgi:hypothetical protein
LYAQSNGLVERAVQTVKDILKKADHEGKDPYLSLLDYRNTQIDAGSPAQLLMGRRLKGKLPTTSNLLKPKLVNCNLARNQLQARKSRQKFYYDKNAKPLKELQQGEHIRIKQQKLWKPAIVVTRPQEDQPRSYIVHTNDGGSYRRNRRDLLKTGETDIYRPVDYEQIRVEEPIEPLDEIVQANQAQPYLTPGSPNKTRSGRVVVKPSRYRDT